MESTTLPANFETFIPEIEATIGYHFSDPSLLCQAFTRGSFCNEANYFARPAFQSNEVLEFFGDSVLSLAIVTHFLSSKIERYEHGIRTQIAEGGFNNIRSHLSDKSNLSTSMKKLGLQKFLLMGVGDKKLGIENERSVMEDLFESILGAIYIDSGYSMSTVIPVVEKILDFTPDAGGDTVIEQSPKNALQEFCDAPSRKFSHEYVILSEEGPDHAKVFVCGCVVNGKVLGKGTARKRKDAEAEAAAAALAVLRKQ